MSNPDDNVSKSNGLGIDPMQRLASFKPPRDLSLGAAKPSKKVFTPNLNVMRNKSKGSLNTRDHRKDDKNKKDRKNDKFKNFKNGPNIIKSSGVFSEGVGSGERHSQSRASYGRDADPKPVLQKPTIRVKDFVKIDKELEEQRIRSATTVSQGTLGDDDIEDFKTSIDNEAPIKLPMDDGGWSNNQRKKAVQVKQEVIVKTEPVDSDIMTTAPEVDIKSIPVVKQEIGEDRDLVDLLRTDQPALVLFTLPDTLPGRGGSASADAPRQKQAEEPSTSSSQDDEEKPTENRCQLRNLEEGRIGKLRIHRSGRVTFALGETIFELNLGTKSAFHQEVVSVASDDTSRSARLVALGPLQHKLAAVPDWETLFKDMRT